MAAASDTRFLVLHGLRLKGFAEPPAVAAVVGVAEGDVAEHLAKAMADELVLRREGRLTGYALTAAGRQEQQQLAVADVAAAGVDAEVRDAYQHFLGLNGRMLSVCTDWQVRDGAPNDHADAAYDESVVGELRDLDAGLAPILASLAGALDRYRYYAPRFASALDRLSGGELEYFTKPIIDSYHTIWFELHEDLLTSLGIERSQEGA